MRNLSDEELRSVMTMRLPVEADAAEFIAAVRRRNVAGLEFGRRCGWWIDYTDAGPLPPPKTVKASDFEGKTLAHVMAHLGFFESVGQARKNGWDKPVSTGVFKVGKTKVAEVV